MLKFLIFIFGCVALVRNEEWIQQGNISPHIVNGSPARNGQFPWQAALQIQGQFGNAFCGGSLIGSRWVLTAAHCINGATSVTVMLGSVSLLQPGLIIQAEKIIKHWLYIPLFSNINDIGLIYLSQKVLYSENIKPIKLPSPGVTYPVGTAVTASGWGLTSGEDTTVSNQLNYVELSTVSCLKISIFLLIAPKHICTKGNTIESPCFGDSGGPLFVGTGDNAVQIGVASFVTSAKCTNGLAGFANVVTLRNWVLGYTGPLE